MISTEAFRADLSANLLGAKLASPAGLSNLLTLRFAATTLFRISQALGPRIPLLAGMVKQFNQFLTGADLAWQAQVGGGVIFFHPVGVVVGPNVRMGNDCTFQQGVTLGGKGGRVSGSQDSPVIGDEVALGSGSKVIGPVRIGHRTKIGANAVVTKDVPADSIAVGVPAAWREAK